MAKIEDMTIEVKAKMSVDRRTAEGCLKMVELYVNESGCNIVCHKQDDGTITFELEG